MTKILFLCLFISFYTFAQGGPGQGSGGAPEVQRSESDAIEQTENENEETKVEHEIKIRKAFVWNQSKQIVVYIDILGRHHDVTNLAMGENTLKLTSEELKNRIMAIDNQSSLNQREHFSQLLRRTGRTSLNINQDNTSSAPIINDENTIIRREEDDSNEGQSIQIVDVKEDVSSNRQTTDGNAQQTSPQTIYGLNLIAGSRTYLIGNIKVILGNKKLLIIKEDGTRQTLDRNGLEGKKRETLDDLIKKRRFLLNDLNHR